MKIDRLIGIITILLQNKKVTAPYLAQRFEVSRRTINRDIEAICKAGIPVVTVQGNNGGITLAEGYKIDKTLFTDQELRAIFTGLSSLDSIAQDKKYQQIIGKFFTDDHGIYAAPHLKIDLSSHYKNALAPKIALIQQAIENATEITFVYFNRDGERPVTLDPYLVVFQWSSWYVFGYDHHRNDFRMYKLNRLWQLQPTEQIFEIQTIPTEKTDFAGYFTDEIQAVVLFEPSVKYRLIDEYGMDCFTVLTDGTLRFEFPFTNKAYLLEWVLSFGDQAELLEPASFRAELKNTLKNSLQKYIE